MKDLKPHEKVRGRKKYPVLRIEAGENAPSPRGIKVFLDGNEITKGLRGLQLHLELDEPLHVHLDIIVRPDIPDMLLKYIKLNVDDPLDLLNQEEAENDTTT